MASKQGFFDRTVAQYQYNEEKIRFVAGFLSVISFLCVIGIGIYHKQYTSLFHIPLVVWFAHCTYISFKDLKIKYAKLVMIDVMQG